MDENAGGGLRIAFEVGSASSASSYVSRSASHSPHSSSASGISDVHSASSRIELRSVSEGSASDEFHVGGTREGEVPKGVGLGGAAEEGMDVGPTMLT